MVRSTNLLPNIRGGAIERPAVPYPQGEMVKNGKSAAGSQRRARLGGTLPVKKIQEHGKR